MKRGRHFFLLILFTIFLLSCQEKKVTGTIMATQSEREEEKKDPFVEGNRKVVQLENEEIELFLQRYGWEMRNTGTGLRIQMLKEGVGKTPKEENTVVLKYKTMFLSGEIIYDSEKDGEKVFVVDKSEEITGLHEAVKLMKQGSKARLVIPSHLGYGTTGDGNRIRGRVPLVMFIELIEIK